MSKFKNALSVVAVSLLSGCQSWPDAGSGGVSEVRSSEHYYISEIGYDENVSTLQYQLAHSRLTLDMLIVKGAKNCLPASVRTTARLINRIQREIDGGLLDDAYGDLVILAESLQKMRTQLSYVTYSTQCASPTVPHNNQLLTEFALNTLKIEIQFDQNSSDISTAYAIKLDEFSDQYQTLKYLSKYPLNINIHAHTDTSGNAADNTLLASQRASAVKTALVSTNISEHLIVIKNSADNAPLLRDDESFSHGLNRRVEVTVTRSPEYAYKHDAAVPIKEWEQSAPMLFEPK